MKIEEGKLQRMAYIISSNRLAFWSVSSVERYFRMNLRTMKRFSLFTWLIVRREE